MRKVFSVVPKKLIVVILYIFVFFLFLEVKTLLEQEIFGKDQKSQQDGDDKTKIRNLEFNANISNDEFDDVMAFRVETMRAACRYHGLDTRGSDVAHQPNPWEYLIAKRDNVNLVWCNVFKAGSSSWMYLFNRLAGYTEKDLNKRGKSPIGLAREKYPRPSVEELSDTLSLPNTIGFLIARNPYERLVSGYREKILGAIRGSPHDKLGREIVIKYRKLDPRQYKWGKTFPTFTEFVRYILDQVDLGNTLDMHWTPVNDFCTPCQVNLNHIIKFETFDRDTMHILKHSRLTEYLPPAEKTLKKNVSKGKQNSSSLVETYLDELPPDLRKNLYDLYRIDFDLFGYKPP